MHVFPNLVTNMFHCAKHNQHANAREHTPQKNFDALRLNLRPFYSQNICMHAI